MSEEKPTFKVTDRRLFNADGTPREGAREEMESAAAAATPTTAQTPTDEAHADAASPTPETFRQGGAEGDEMAAEGASASAREADAGAARSAADDDDPQDFLMVVEFIGSFAAEALGMSAHPVASATPQVNLPLAKQCIDMLGTLQKKTRGNLNAEEKQFFDLILSQLRMQYVSLSSARPGGGAGRNPRGFTGNDITGGR
ncbi:MAG TPA: DUF1844 domain-containing protein [Pyrinomonadaceae bacterium]|nr:DUF1844 domain-containing protein [Pyrinomonadaceae bacterium]